MMLLLANVVLIAIYLPSLADKVPVHFSVSGEADNWGSKHMLWVGPVLAFGMYLFMSYASRQRSWYILPKRSTHMEERFLLTYKMMRALKIVVMLFFIVLSFCLIRSAQGKPAAQALYLILILLFLVLTPVVYYTDKISKLK